MTKAVGPTRVAAVVLAAGQSRRFGGDSHATKLVARVRGAPLVRAVAMVALGSRVVSVTIVSGHAQDEVVAALSGLEVDFVHNADFATGMASSLEAGLAAVSSDVDGVLVMLADMPSVEVRTLDRLIGCFDSRPAEIDAVVPIYEGRRGNPVLIGRRLFASVQALTGDQGAGRLLLKPDLVIASCEVDDSGVTIDIDTLAELEAVRRSG